MKKSIINRLIILLVCLWIPILALSQTGSKIVIGKDTGIFLLKPEVKKLHRLIIEYGNCIQDAGQYKLLLTENDSLISHLNKKLDIFDKDEQIYKGEIFVYKTAIGDYKRLTDCLNKEIKSLKLQRKFLIIGIGIITAIVIVK